MAIPKQLWKCVYYWLICCLLLLQAGSATADTTISGAITQNTLWRANQSPYVLLVDTVIDQGATLTIEAGTTVFVSQGTSLIVKQGALQAMGSAAAPITITSIAEKSGTAAPGDWGQLRFLPGTQGAQTVLEHVRIKFGSGVAMEKASPTLRSIALQNHRGAAISIDLFSSPLGDGLSASGNDINGIVVPAGTITGAVQWGLVGIPYLIAQGWVNIGQAPIALEPGALTLNPGVQASLRVHVATPAPVGGLKINFVSSIPSVVSLPASVTIPEGATWADIALDAISLGSVTVTASQAQMGSATASVQVANLPTLQLAPSLATFGVSRPLPMSVRLPAPAPGGGVKVTLSSSDTGILAVPNSVVVAAGNQSAAFSATGMSEGDAIVLAQATDYASATARLAVRPRALVLPASAVVAPGASINVALSLTEAAPAGGLTVNLASSRTDIASVPSSLVVPAGESNASVAVQGLAVGTATLTASASAYQPGSTAIAVDSIAIDLDPVGDISVPQGVTVLRRVRLSKPAPSGGVTIALNSNDSAISTVEPTEVFVPQGQTVATRSIAIRGAAKGKTALLASASGLSGKTVNVTVSDPAVLRFYATNGRNVLTLGKGLKSYIQEIYVERLVNGVRLNSPDALTVRISCVSNTVCSGGEVTIPAGQGYAYFQATGVDAGSTELKATADGYADATGFKVSVVTPELEFLNLDGSRSVASARDDFYLRFKVPGAYYNNSQTAAADAVVHLSLSDQSPQGIVSGFYNAATGGSTVTQVLIAAGRSDSYDRQTHISQPTATGSYTVTATLPGVVTSVSAQQVVTAPALRIRSESGRTSTVLGKGLKSYYRDLYVERTVNGARFNGAEALTVSLSCASSAVCTTPTTVTIPAGQYYVYFQASGVEVGSTELKATANGHADATGMKIDVLAPELEFINLDGSRSISSARDDFYLRFKVPGAYYNYSQTAAADAVVNLSLSDQSPQGIVSGFYNAATGGSTVTQVVIAAGRSDSYDRQTHISQPTATGSYTVTATLPGVVTSVSAQQVVTAPALRIRSESGRTSTVLGKGLKSYNRDLYVERTVNGVRSNSAEALTVSISCVSNTVCSGGEVTIPAGQGYVYFQATGIEVGSTELKATASGHADATGMKIDVVAPELEFVNLDGSRSLASARDDFYLRFRVPGAYYSYSQTAAVDAAVNLAPGSQSPPGIVSGFYDAATGGNAVTQLVIPAGRSDNANKVYYVERPTAAGNYTLAATWPGIVSVVSAVQTVTAPALRVASPSSRKFTVLGKGLKSYTYELYVERVVNGTRFNGVEAMTVNLACASAAVCTVPAIVTIPAGQGYVYFQATGVDPGSTMITASAANYVDADGFDVSVVLPVFQFNNLPGTLTVGASANFSISVSTPGAYGTQIAVNPVAITLSNAVPGVAQTADTASIAAGAANSPNIQIKGLSPGDTAITASAPGITPQTSGTVRVQP